MGSRHTECGEGSHSRDVEPQRVRAIGVRARQVRKPARASASREDVPRTIRSIAPVATLSVSIQPVPFLGSDNTKHLFYELHLTNTTDLELHIQRFAETHFRTFRIWPLATFSDSIAEETRGARGVVLLTENGIAFNCCVWKS